MMSTSVENQEELQGKNVSLHSFGHRRRRRAPPSTLPTPSPPPQQYAIILHNGNSTSDFTSLSNTSPSAKASLVKLTRIPFDDDQLSISSPSTGQHDERKQFLCLYEETKHTELGINTTTLLDDDKLSYEECYSQLSEEIKYCFPINYSILAPENGKPESSCNTDGDVPIPIECINFIQWAISSWYYRQLNGNHHVIPRTDVECLYQILATNITSSQHNAYDHYCSCNYESCIADTIITALGLEDNIPKRQQQTLHNPRDTTKFQKPLRLILARCMLDENNVREDAEAALNDPAPQSSRSYAGIITLLPSSAKIPLISISLSPHEKNDSMVITDALLRACVKRLLVGRILLHSELQVKRKTKENTSTLDTLSFRTNLSVEVPHKPSSPGESQNKKLEFMVTDVQSTVGQSATAGVGSAQLPTLFVILPSTRIIFQSCEEKVDSLQNVREAKLSMNLPHQKSITQIPSLPSHTDPTPMPPHLHLLESLQSIMFFQSDQTQTPIPRSFLFTGPPGVGKTFSVKKAISIANSWKTSNAEHDAVHLISLRGSELLATASSSGGNYATAARELERQFRNAANVCRLTEEEFSDEIGMKAVVVFLDECDALVSSSIVAAMLAVILDKMEGVVDLNKDSSGWARVLVVAATNRVDAIPGFLRRPGRLEKEVVVSPPNVNERFSLLKSMLGSPGSVVIDDAGLQKVSEACVGYVAADLSALIRRAAILSIEKKFHNQECSPQHTLQGHPIITAEDLFSAMSDVGASCLRDASLSAPPRTSWDDIAGDAGGAKRSLREAIEWPRTRRSAFKALGLSPPRGVLLHGPPGCAKTTLARAAAGAAGVAFLSLSPADVYASSYVGDAEGIVRRAFDLARAAAPCVLFFDEIDAIIGGDDGGGNGKPGHGMGRGTSAEARVLSTFLNEMDGVDGSVEDGVLVLGATNRPGLIDAALLRPGRFDRVIYVPPPDELGRKAILAMECRKWHNALLAYTSSRDTCKNGGVEEYFDINILASDVVSGSMTGAEIVGACRETAVQVMCTLMQSHNNADQTLSKESAKSLMQSLMIALEASLRSKIPLLSNAQVLEEYTRFDNERK